MLEAAIISQDKHRLSHLAESGNKSATIMRQLLAQHTERLLAAILLCNNLANVSCAASATALLTHWMGASETVLLIATLLVTFALLVFSEITPKVIGVRHSQRISLFAARILQALITVLAPIIWVVQKLAAALLKLIYAGKKPPPPDVALNARELRTVIRMTGRARNDPHYQMVETALLFAEMPVEKIMTPRRDIIGIDLADDESAIARAVLGTEFAKLPLYRGAIDQSTHYINCAQAIRHIRDGRLSAATLEQIATAFYVAPAAATALSQLQNMRKAKSALGLVVDGGGRVVGLLTFSNFAAAILGEEKTGADIKRHGDAYVTPADMSVTQFGIETGRALPDTQASSINGMILDYLGDLPAAPVCLVIDGWQIEILTLSAQAVERVRLMPPSEEGDD